MTKAYAGIGSRQTPDHILAAMTSAASYLCEQGFTLRSGGADGADTAFEDGVSDHKLKQIFVPWPKFNQRYNHYDRIYNIPEEAFAIAAKYHPAWSKLTQGVQKLMARNVQQVLGEHLDDPSQFVICWTPNGSTSGGTGQAIRIANDRGIPVIDLGSTSLDEASQRIIEFTSTIKP